MPISKEQLIGFCREGHLYHLAQGRSWLKIREHGLRSTSSILDLFEITGPERFAIESQRRPESRTITHPLHGKVRIRDQRPLNEAMLGHCLEGCTREQFHRLLNDRIFFWLEFARVKRMMRAYQDCALDLLTIDAARFIDAYEENIELSHLNSGATRSVHHKRGLDLFKKLSEFPYDRTGRNGKQTVAELTVKGKVEDIDNFVRLVKRTNGVEWEIV